MEYIKLFLLVLLMAFVGNIGAVMAASDNLTPDELVSKIKEMVNDYREVVAYDQALAKFGNAALPAIDRGLAEGTVGQRWCVLRALADISGDESTSLLVEVIGRGYSDSLTGWAISFLENRPIRRPLSPEELEALVSRIENKVIGVASLAAMVLSNCEKMSVDVRLTPILARFKKEIISPTDFPTPTNIQLLDSSPLPPRINILGSFLISMKQIGEGGIPKIREARKEASGNTELDKWLLLALGMAGDKSIAGELKEFIQKEPDRYIRAEAVHAYAASAKQDAVPFLTTLLDDTTESEYGRDPNSPTGKARLISDAAKNELAGLKPEPTVQK